MTKQPEALRLADVLQSDFDPDWMYEFGYDQTAAELRRLHEVNQELLEVLKSADWYIDQLEQIVYEPDDTGVHEEHAKIRAAIAKATGETT